MRQIKEDLNRLKENDIVNLLLFCIYKLSEKPEYAVLSELAYTLDKDSILKLCSIFGGCDITIPTLQELNTLIKVLLIIQYVNFEHYSFKDACELVDIENIDKNKLLNMYNIMSASLEEFFNEK